MGLSSTATAAVLRHNPENDRQEDAPKSETYFANIADYHEHPKDGGDAEAASQCSKVDKDDVVQFSKLSEKGKEIYTEIRNYYWRYILIPIIVYGSLRMIRPHEPFIATYLLNQGSKPFPKDAVVNTGTLIQYSTVILFVPIFGYLFDLDGKWGLKKMLIWETIFSLFSRFGFLVAPYVGLGWMYFCFFTLGLSAATETFLFVYRAHIIDMFFNQQMVSISTASFHIASFISGLISKGVLEKFKNNYTYLFYISLAMGIISAVYAFCYFPSNLCRMNYCFSDIPNTMRQIKRSYGVGVKSRKCCGFQGEPHLNEELLELKDGLIQQKKNERHSDHTWAKKKLYEKISPIKTYIMARKSGIYWTLAWVIVTVCHRVIAAEIAFKWRDIVDTACFPNVGMQFDDCVKGKAEDFGLYDGLSNLGALVGCLIPLALERWVTCKWGPSRSPRSWAGIGLICICAYIYALSVTNDLITSYWLFVGYQLFVTWIHSFISCQWTSIIRSEDPEGKAIMYLSVFTLAMIVIGLQVPVHAIWHLDFAGQRLMYYCHAMAVLSLLCLLTVPWWYEEKGEKSTCCFCFHKKELTRETPAAVAAVVAGAASGKKEGASGRRTRTPGSGITFDDDDENDGVGEARVGYVDDVQNPSLLRHRGPRVLGASVARIDRHGRGSI